MEEEDYKWNEDRKVSIVERSPQEPVNELLRHIGKYMNNKIKVKEEIRDELVENENEVHVTHSEGGEVNEDTEVKQEYDSEPVSNDVTLKNATEAESHDRVIREVSPLSEEEEVAKPWKIDLNEIEFREYVRIQLAKAKSD